jgi:integrase
MPAAEGTIRKRSENSLSIIANYKDPDSGKWNQKWETVKRHPGESDRALRSRAEEELQALLVRLRTGATVVRGRLTLSDYIEDWLTTIRPDVSERTVSGYRSVLNRHVLPVIGNKQLKSIRPSDIQRIYVRMAESGLSGVTRLHVHRTLSKALADAVRAGKLAENPAARDRMRAPKATRRTIRQPEPDEVNRLIEAAQGTRIEALVPLLAFTGLRVGEALGLRWSDLDLTGERHRVAAREDGKSRFVPVPTLEVNQTRKQRESKDYGEPKTERSQRKVAIAPALVTILREHRARQLAFNLEHGFVPAHDLVFTEVSREGVVGMTHDNVSNAWKTVRVKANVPNARLHDLRHFAATTLIDAGVPLTNVSEILGHSQTSTTANVYAHAIRNRNAAAMAEIEKVLTDRRAKAS